MEEQFQLLFDKMKIELATQSFELKETITNTIISKMDEKLEPVLAENKNLKLKIENLENEIKYLKREKKSNNIIIFGLKEDEGTTAELIKKVKDNFKSDWDIDMEKHEVNKIYRIRGAKKAGDEPRPVLLSFVTGWKKSEVMRNKKKFKEVYVTEDYPKEVLEKRKELQPKLMEERSKGNIAYLQYDKLIVKDNTNKEKRKRELSTSPQNNSQPKKQQNLTSFKANRTNAFDIMRARSNSL